MQNNSTGRIQLESQAGRCIVLTTAKENAIVEWVKRITRRGLPVRRDDIVSSVQKILEGVSDHETPFCGRKLGKAGFRTFCRGIRIERNGA